MNDTLAPFNSSTIIPPLNFSVMENMTMEVMDKPPVSGLRDMWYWRVWLFAVGGAFIECIGMICNIIAIIVLAHFRNKSSAPFLLICLAVADSLYLVSFLFLENITLISMGGLIGVSYREFIAPIYSVLYPLPFICQTYVAYLVVIITSERYFVVTWPLVAHSLCSMKSAVIAVVTTLALAILYHTPTFMAFHYPYVWNNKTQTGVRIFMRTDFGNSYFYNEVYYKWMNLSFNFLLPFTALLILNTLTIRTLRRGPDFTVTAHNRVQKERRLTIMVICMTVIFFFCELMAALSLILTSGMVNYRQVPRDINRFSAVADTFMLINSAINFAIYCATGRKFRETFTYLFCRCCSEVYKRPMGARRRLTTHKSKNRTCMSCWGKLFRRQSRGSHTVNPANESSVSSVSNGTKSFRLNSHTSTSADDIKIITLR